MQTVRTLFILFAVSIQAFAAEAALPGRSPWEPVIDSAVHQYPAIPRGALEYAFRYLETHYAAVGNLNFLTLIDFSQPSTEERMYVIELGTGNTKSYLSAHGKNSGELMAERFSNEVGSNMSSLGIYLTGEEYNGSNGLSLILRGKEPTNSNAERRAIVLHGADYVSYDFIHRYGRLGRSLGCPAVNPAVVEDLVHKLSGGSVLFLYHPSLPL